MEMAKAELQDMKVKSFFWKNKDEKDEKKKKIELMISYPKLQTLKWILKKCLNT